MTYSRLKREPLKVLGSQQKGPFWFPSEGTLTSASAVPHWCGMGVEAEKTNLIANNGAGVGGDFGGGGCFFLAYKALVG